MANIPQGSSPQRRHASAQRAVRSASHASGAGTRFKQKGQERRSSQAAGVQPYRRSSYSTATASATRGHRRPQQRRRSKAPIVFGLIAAIVVVALVVFFVVPTVKSAFFPEKETVEAGLDVSLTIPEGASGDEIASLLASNHVIENPKDYYAAVTRANAESSLKPGSYLFKTCQDPDEVVQLLVSGPNAGVTLTIQEGLTVAQTAQRVEESCGISADDFIAQAKASNYVSDYPFLEGAYDDSLEGYLYPKTYTFSDSVTADEIIRKLLDQFQSETASIGLEDGANGLTAQQIVTMASLIERETAVESERPTVASVIYNRLNANMMLQIDAAIVYARGGGSQSVTYSDLEIDSPYNVYKNYGLTPGPICSPSVSSIKAALNPDSTDYLYYVASAAGDGSHKFSSDYSQFEKDSEEYAESLNS